MCSGGSNKKRIMAHIDEGVADAVRAHAHYTSQPLAQVVEDALARHIKALIPRRIEGYDRDKQCAVVKEAGDPWPNFDGELRRGRPPQ